jgi:hypothetical protein
VRGYIGVPMLGRSQTWCASSNYCFMPLPVAVQ